jgi:2'-5' RNA ligase
MRLFTAVELPQGVRDHLAALGRRLRAAGGHGIKLVDPDSLHVTLKFLGDVADGRVAELSGALAGIVPAGAIGPLIADRAELLPPRGPVRVIAAGLGGDGGAVRRLFESIEGRCAELGFPAEKRDYRPHVTLARSRVPLPGSSREHITDVLAAGLPGPPFTVTHFTLFRSDLKPTGPQYTALARFPLAGP